MISKNIQNITLLVIIVVCFIILIYFSTKIQTPVSDILQTASKDTKFSPVYFDIYDKSTETSCTRLIRIYPFNWNIVSINNQVYVLDSESGYTCQAGYTPGIKIIKSNNLEVECLSTNKDGIFRYFQNLNPIRVEYSLDGREKFTVMDALNYLFDGYLTLTDDDADVEKKILKKLGIGNYKLKTIPRQKLRTLRVAPTEKDKNISAVTKFYLKQNVKKAIIDDENIKEKKKLATKLLYETQEKTFKWEADFTQHFDYPILLEVNLTL